MKKFKTAFILGAGLGTRLRPLTEHCPKPLLPLDGRPVITHAMDHLLQIGIERFIVNTHHCPEIYRQKFPDNRWRGVPIIFRHEPVLLDTAGGLKNIEDLLGDEQTILCYNGDVIADFPLQKLVQYHLQNSPEVTLVLRSTGGPLNVIVDEGGRICDIRGKTQQKGAKACVFTGIYGLETDILRHIEPGKPETVINTFVQRIVEQPGSIMGIVIDEGNWDDIGSPESYRNLVGRRGG